MSEPPPSYPVPSGYPPGHPPLPLKYRPGWAWFVVGGGLIVVAIIVGIAMFVWLLSAFFATDATLPADGRPHAVTVGTDGDRMLWRDSTVFDPGCEVVDRSTDQQVHLRPVTTQMTKDFNEDHWTAAYRFDPGSGELDVTCTSGSGVQIGPAPSVGGFIGGLVATIAVSGLIGLLGLATLLVTGIMWTTRPARPRD